MSEIPVDDTRLPGGAERHGNFKTYYKFNPAEARTKLLPSELLQECLKGQDQTSEVICLDVGCNTGVRT